MRHEAPPGWAVIESAEDGFCADRGRLRIIVSWGGGWEHVSVSHRDRCPMWEEMEHVAQWFWPDETAVQYHAPATDHVNIHPHCLHWWRPIGVDLPRPARWMV